MNNFTIKTNIINFIVFNSVSGVFPHITTFRIQGKAKNRKQYDQRNKLGKGYRANLLRVLYLQRCRIVRSSMGTENVDTQVE